MSTSLSVSIPVTVIVAGLVIVISPLTEETVFQTQLVLCHYLNWDYQENSPEFFHKNSGETESSLYDFRKDLVLVSYVQKKLDIWRSL